MRIDVLDHGFVRLVSYMQPVLKEAILDADIEAGFPSETVLVRDPAWNGDLEIVRNARVSHDADWRHDGTVIHEAFCASTLPPMSNGDKRDCNCKPRTVSDERLINYMAKNNHTTPFEAMVFTFEVKAPIFVFRQWHRHRTWSYNEVSARYTELPEDFYVPSADKVGVQDNVNKQSRDFSQLIAGDYAERDRQYKITESMRILCENSFVSYRNMLGEGVPRELARLVLPLGTYSRMFATVDLHNLFHFLRLRLHKHAQWEIQQYAGALLDLITPVVPVATAAFVNGLNFEEYGMRYTFKTEENPQLDTDSPPS
jgi:thymidylate synthase (FAD)